MSDLSPDYFTKPVAEVDPEIAQVLKDEAQRQETTLEMIASENFVPQAILDCQGSVLTNKYAEGYPGKRYYGGCEHVDVAEQLAIDRAKELFGAEHVNVQPHSGRPGQLRRLHGAARARRPHPRHEARPRRPSHARDEDQLLRALLRHRGLRRARGGLAPRHGRAAAARRGRAAQADPGRLVGLSAPARLRALPRDRRLGGRPADGRHGALRRPRGRRAAPQPDPLLRRGHHHHAQDARRRARGHDPVPRGVRQEDQLARVPGPPGRAAHARDRRQGGGAEGGPERAVPRAPAAHPRGRGRAGGGDAGRRGERAHRRHRRSPRARRPARLRARRPAGRGPPARGRHHRQPQLRAVRPAPARGVVGPADRGAGAGHARLRRGRLPRDRQGDRRGAHRRLRRLQAQRALRAHPHPGRALPALPAARAAPRSERVARSSSWRA